MEKAGPNANLYGSLGGPIGTVVGLGLFKLAGATLVGTGVSILGVTLAQPVLLAAILGIWVAGGLLLMLINKHQPKLLFTIQLFSVTAMTALMLLAFTNGFIPAGTIVQNLFMGVMPTFVGGAAGMTIGRAIGHRRDMQKAAP